jgi:membrane associated rhomboid family serine protease
MFSARWRAGMGLYDRPYYQGDAPGGIRFGFPQSAVGQLILANVVLYLVDVLLTGGSLSRGLLALHAPSLLRPWMWWQLITYGFMHDPSGVGHILGNMLGLFFFGRTVEGVYGRRVFLAFYFTALLLGGIGTRRSRWLVRRGRSSPRCYCLSSTFPRRPSISTC